MLAYKQTFLDPSSQGTGMTGEGGYLHDTILFSGSQCLGTGMTGGGGYLHDTILFSGSQCLSTGMTRKEHWDDILPSGDCSQITMFVQ
ncbi:hypothetical protein [Wolbachia pipientis]|uniref:hypothetical protein n=2 Tax=Wolbachia TaxID=953 RepID=UPI0015F8A50A|nr:hypothetical protein [Wolbachia pipientis]MBA8756946.1 hypothetical protein [Wolbachia pipientis]